MSIIGGSGGTDNGSVVFTITANPALDSSLSVSVQVSRQGDYVIATGTMSVTIGTG